MKDQLKTTREGIEAAIASGVFIDKPVRRALLDALTALSELERMAGEPVASIYITPGGDREFDDWRHDLPAGRNLLYAAPPAQQQQAEAHKPLFADAIAKHPGLREELKAMDEQPQAEAASPEFTDSARAALLWVLWHHQGGGSKVGQPIRFALGMGQFDRLNEHQLREAKRWGELQGQQAEAVPSDVVRVSVETLNDWKSRVNTLSTLTTKVDRYSFGIKLKQDIADAAQGEKP